MSGAPKILVVDDRPENLVALEALLKNSGAEVLKADSGERALERLLEHEVALAMLDVQMPGLDGFQLAELMRGLKRTREIPIIFVTAGIEDQSRVFKGYESGAVDFLVKPLDPRILASKVGVFLQMHRQKVQLAERVEELESALAERRRIERRMAADHAAMVRLHELSARLVSQAALPTLLQATLEAAIALTGADMGTLQVHDEATGSLRTVAHQGFPEPFLSRFASLHDGPAAQVEAARTGRRVVVEDVAGSEALAGTGEKEFLECSGARAVQWTPLISRDGGLLGVVSTHWKQPHHPAEDMLRLLDLLAREAADLLEYRRREEALSAANARLVEESRRKNEFLAVLSHELRNPLAPIRNSLYILERAAPGSEQARRAQQIIDRQVTQLANLVNDLLDVTRISRNKIKLQREPFELGEQVRRTAEDHRAAFERNGVRLEVAVAREPAVVVADRTRVAQVLSNLLQNSAKFTPSGGRTRISVAPEAGEAVVRVVDDGSGMAPETLSRLFQPFMQAEQALDRSLGGLGLGLALVKGMVELHGGRVAARSQGLGKGSEFEVRLPLDGSAALPSRRARASGAEPAARRVLVVEDNPDAADSLKEALELAGHEVEVAYDGPEALARAHEFRPDAVLCDIGLPGLSGYDVARAFRSDPDLKDVSLVAVSGYALPEDLERATEAGFDGHVAKPPSLEKIAELLRRPRA